MEKSSSPRSDVIHLGVLVALAVALGIYLIGATVLISKDGVFYIGLAQSLFDNLPAVLHRHSLGYPALIRIVHLFAGGDSIQSWVHSSQSAALLCRVLALIPLYLLARGLVGSRHAFWALLILIVLPYPAHYGGDALRDWPYVLFLSLGLWLLHAALHRRTWWMFAPVGLVAAGGYFVQPAAVQLLLYGLLGLAVVRAEWRRKALWEPVAAAVLLLAGFAIPVMPHVYASGTPIPRQWNPPQLESPPAIVAVGGKSAESEPLEFGVREGETLETAIEAFDPQGDALSFSLVGVPVDSRPVYQFRPAGTQTRFQTILERERNALIQVYSQKLLKYEGIVCYAFGQGDARTGLTPVYRLWSPVLGRHFYTIDASERDAVIAESSDDRWVYEATAFYAYADGGQPPDAVPVRRFRRGQAGHFWALAGPVRQGAPVSDANAVDEGIAWCVHVPGEPPAGMSLEGNILQWRPSPGQIGDHQVNIIVSDGEMESCQLVKITVTERATPGSHRLDSPGPDGLSGPDGPHGRSSYHSREGTGQFAGLQNLPGAADRLFDGTAELLMVVFFVPWCVGLYHRMRHEAQHLERVLFTAVLTVNAGLVLARYAWLQTTFDRRYCLALVALTIFYVPVGLDLIAQWLRARRVGPFTERRWFHILAALGIAVCMPKLLSPLNADKRHYLSAIQWIRDNTQRDEVVATPDPRIAFYAGRQALLCGDTVDPRKADYFIRFINDGPTISTPIDWSEEYSAAGHRGKTVIVYRTHRNERRSP